MDPLVLSYNHIKSMASTWYIIVMGIIWYNNSTNMGITWGIERHNGKEMETAIV